MEALEILLQGKLLIKCLFAFSTTLFLWLSLPARWTNMILLLLRALAFLTASQSKANADPIDLRRG